MVSNSVVIDQPKFLHAEEVAAMLGVSTSSAYRIIKRLNADLEKQGKIVIPGRISSRYFLERVAM